MTYCVESFYRRCPVCRMLLGKRFVIPWHDCPNLPKAVKLWRRERAQERKPAKPVRE